MLISQIIDTDGRRRVVARNGTEAYAVSGVSTTYDLALDAVRAGQKIRQRIAELGFAGAVDLEAAYADGRLLAPIDHPDPAHLHLTGTGLTHLGSASARDEMHRKLTGEAAVLTDSMKMFRMGLEGGKPADGSPGVQPEWFYKGNGLNAVAPVAPLVSPAFSGDGGEEPEIAGCYVVGDDGVAHRIGFVLANEFSDHVTERVNYLWLAHSKLRPAAFGPEILLGDLPENVVGTSRIRRDGVVVWEKPFLSGEANMSHSIANLEHHHFKYRLFRHPGDVHLHMFGTATLSFSDGFATKAGDVFEIEAAPFGLPLRNPLAVETAPAADSPVAVMTL